VHWLNCQKIADLQYWVQNLTPASVRQA